MRDKFNKEHVLSLCKPGDYGIMAPPMDAQVALNELCRYFLGKIGTTVPVQLVQSR